ncbi:hypothetical protein [Candidatus Mycoplasma mahonii]|uniref:hypothetical protein n=1 Tax=Candidatus Mycoplasma mahonii TaxID=3004105 RepID=UPI0026EDC8F6|nr:hypothetical protein [Candidatus Mycoplasma mahonii]WKX02591.1 hypothetical protein O3I44_00735 [Candidatus Mycoplasma mahonii]
MNKRKFYLIAGSTLMLAAPIVGVVACGNSTDTPMTLTLSMRSEDINPWRNAMDKFTEKTGIKVKTVLVGDQKANYATWSGTDSMPDIALIDQNTAKDAIKENKWFQPIDLTEIKDAKYDVVNATPQEFDFENEDKYAASKVFASFYSNNVANGGGDHNVIGIPYGYGSQGIFFNKLNLDLTKPLNAYVPKKDGTFAEIEIAQNPTMDTIKTFLANSGTVTDLKTNNVSKSDQEIDTAIKLVNPNLEWYNKGPYAMYQRLGSIGKSLGANNSPGWIKDIGFPFELIASSGDGIFNGTVLDDAKLQTLFPVESGEKSSEAEFLKLYQSYFGYFNRNGSGSYAANPKSVGTPGEADALWEGQGNIMLGYKWQSKMIKDNWYRRTSPNDNNELYDNAIEVLPSPYGSIGVDALALFKNLLGQKLENAKKFLRFVFEQDETDNAYKITLQKTISPIIAAESKQKNAIDSNNALTINERLRQKAFFDSSKGESYNNVSGGIMASSTDGIYDIYNGQYGGDDGLKGVLLGDSRPNDYTTWKAKFDSILSNVRNEIAIKNVGI